MMHSGKGWVALLGILLYFALTLASVVDDSPTMDEQNHIARGLALLRTGDPHMSLEHPPLVNSLSALPLLTLPEIRLPTDHPSWQRPEGWYEFAALLLWDYNHDVTRMVFLARIPIIFLGIGLALTGFHFARAVWGKNAALFALFFLLFDPNLLAHSRYATTDLGGTAFMFLSAFLLWRMWQLPGWRASSFVWAALALGLALSAKMSILAFVPIFALLALLPVFPQSWSLAAAARRLSQLLLALPLAFAVVWASYGFQWGALEFQTPWLAFLERFNGPMYGPMPTYWAGVEQILLLTQGARPAFLLGTTSLEGFVAYFPIAFLVKTPLPTLALLLVTLIFLLRPATPRAWKKKVLFFLFPALIYFLLSLQSSLNIGYRHLLPTIPFLYLAGTGLFTPGLVQRPSLDLRLQRLAPLLFAGALLLTTLAIHPHYLSYFNLAAGGPRNGYNILIDSNIDWGQDLLRLRRWMDENEVDHVKLAWFGSAEPAYYGISYDPLPGLPHHFDLWFNVPFDPAQPEPGTYVISVSNLWELPLQDKYVFSYFRQRQPDARVGYSIMIYEVH